MFHFWIHIVEKLLCSQNQNKSVCWSSVSFEQVSAYSKYSILYYIQYYCMLPPKILLWKTWILLSPPFFFNTKKILAKSCFLPQILHRLPEFINRHCTTCCFVHYTNYHKWENTIRTYFRVTEEPWLQT